MAMRNGNWFWFVLLIIFNYLRGPEVFQTDSDSVRDSFEIGKIDGKSIARQHDGQVLREEGRARGRGGNAIERNGESSTPKAYGSICMQLAWREA